VPLPWRRPWRLRSALADIARADPATEALDALVAAYPELLARHDGQSVFWRDGTVMRASDGRAEKSFDLLLKDASILDQFHLTYPRGRSPTPPALNEDPGRFRNEAFFRKMYGDCHKGELDQRLVTVTWLPKSWGKPVRVTDVTGVAEKLKAVSTEIDALRMRSSAQPTRLRVFSLAGRSATRAATACTPTRQRSI
jgi:hypothetical protein